MARDKSVLARAIVPRTEVVARTLDLIDSHGARELALGNSTQSREIEGELLVVRPALMIRFVDEFGSTLEARDYYWAASPPRGWRRLLPLSLQTPPEPLDDWAAVVLAHRYFAGEIS